MLRKKLKLTDNDTKNVDKTDKCEVNTDERANMLWEKVLKSEILLGDDLMKIDYKKDNKDIAAIYNPLDYAIDLHIEFLKKYLKSSPEVLFLGMNPGLNGMAQSAVPFGHVPSVKNWMKLSETVHKPKQEIPSKPIKGLECTTEEPSGKRFWGLLQELCGEPENFFNKCWVHNICPLAFLTSTGRNITPTELKGHAKTDLNTICLNHLKEIIEIFNPKIIIAIGSYANDCVKKLKKKNLISESIDCKLLAHPSPRAINNQNWVEKAKQWYIDNDIIQYFQHQS